MSGEELLGFSLAGGMLVFILLLLIAFYIYGAMAWMTIAKKLNYKYPWLAWIPIANFAMILQLGNYHWAFVLLLFVPIVNLAFVVLMIVATWRVYEKRGYPGALSLVGLASIIPFIGFIAGIAQLVILGLVAWKDKEGLAPHTTSL